ncbi:hypothetical protein QJQ45_006663 [Haematococcus lacustris]|nr:hypothetical protein QJQ45_006663 [Haematococcus lacustris]
MYVGASGSGQQEVVGERRQVIKAAIRGLVEAARPELSPAQVDTVVAEMNKRMTMGSKQCCLTAVLSLTMLLQSFLGQPTEGFPAAGPAPGPPPPPDPACPPYSHPRLAAATPAGTALDGLQAHILAPSTAAPPVPLNIWDPKLLAQIKDAMELLTTARVLEQPPGWLDRDTNACLNFQRIEESMQRPLELCSRKDREALPPVGKEYQQGYKRVNDRLPKVRQRLHRAAEYRRGIDGRARNNA